VVVQAKVAVLSGVALTLADLGRDLGKAARVAKELKARIAIKARKSTMASLLL
jgi:hypothetical protein